MPDSTQNISARNEQVQEILTKVPHWLIGYGNSIVLLLVMMLLFITWFVKYPDVINTQVMLTSENPPERIFARSAGRLQSLFVEDQQAVKAGEHLAVVHNSANYSDVLHLKQLIEQPLKERGTFYFPLEELPILLLGDLNDSFSNFESKYLEYRLNEQLKPFQNESVANQQSLLETRMRLENLRSQKQLAERELSLQERDFERQISLFKDGLISPQTYDREEIALIQARKSMKNLEVTISQTREMIGNAERTLKGTNIEQSMAQVRLLRNTLQAYFQLKKGIADWEQQYVLMASIDGYVSMQDIWHENQHVNVNQMVFTVIPHDTQGYLGKISAPAANSGKIKPGQQVQIRLADYPSEEFGELRGKVDHIAPIPDQDNQYQVNIILPGELRTSYGRQLNFRQEMKGTADIITEDLRLIERLFYQFRGLLN